MFTLQVVDLLNKMQLSSEHLEGSRGQDVLRVVVPPTRSDVLHACDVMEVGGEVYLPFSFERLASGGYTCT